MSRMTTGEIKDALAVGAARLSYIKSEEAWYSNSAMIGQPPGVKKSWSVSVDALDDEGKEDGTYGEWSFDWYQFSHDKGLLFHVEASHDAFNAIAAVEGLLPALAALCVDAEVSPTPEQVEAALVSLGFVDTTKRDSPCAEEMNR